MEPQFNPVDEFGEANRYAYEKLVHALAAKPAVALVGAGFSRRVGYPLWPGFLSILRTRAFDANPTQAALLEKIDRSDNMLVKAGRLKKVLGPELFADLIVEVFGPRTPQHDEVHRSFVSLPFRHFLTTNYDPVIEEAYRAVRGKRLSAILVDDECRAFLPRMGLHETEPHCIHLHGSTARPDDVILTLDDYNRFYQQEQTKFLLNTICTFHTVVFIGFSFSDLDLMGRFRDLANLLGGSEARHAAILESPDIEKLEARRIELNDLYQVEPIFYSPRDAHAQLAPLVAQLVVDVQRAREAHSRDLSVGLTEGLIDDLLPPDVAEKVRHRLSVAILAGGLQIPIANVAAGEHVRGSLDEEIDAIHQFTQRGLPDVAIQRYEAILNRPGMDLSGRLKYRLHANIGNALYNKGDSVRASEAYLRAISFWNESRDSRAIEVLAYFLLEDHRKAHQLASALCEDEPEFGRAHSLRIRTLPSDVSFATAEASVPVCVRAEAEVAMALADLAGNQGHPELQETYLRRAVAANPDWPDSLNALAGFLVLDEREQAEIDAETGPIARHVERVQEAETILDRAIAKTPGTDPMGRLAGLYLNRSIARRMLGKLDESRADTAEAFRREPADPEIAIAEALNRETEGDLDAAIACLVALPSGTRRQDFLLAALLDERGRLEDIERATTLVEFWLERLDELTPDYRRDVCLLVLRLLTRVDRVEEARRRLANIPTGTLSPASEKVLWARLALAEGRNDDAIKVAAEAAEALGDGTSWFDRREVAVLAHELHLWPVAFRIWKELVLPTRFGRDTQNLLRAAYFAREEKFILEFCDALREAGVHSRECYQIQADILMKHREPERALALLQYWMTDHTDDVDARLSLSVIARQSGNHSLAEDDPVRLPSVESVESPNIGSAVVYVLRHGKYPESGLDYAYELWRRFPDEKASRHALVSALFNPNAPPVELARPTTVVVGSAVLVREDGEQPRWVVIETGARPSLTRGEYPAEHPFARAMIGLSPGEDFSYTSRSHRVMAVENRIVFRGNECLSNWEELFPDQPFFRRFKLNLDAPEEADFTTKLGDVWKELERQEQERLRFEGVYQQHRAPISTVARRLGRRVFDTVRHFASSSGLMVHCSLGLPEEWDAAVKRLESNPSVVLDPTAVATLYLLSLHTKLKDLPIRCIVPRSVLDELRDIITDSANVDEPRGFLGSVNGKPFLQEVPAEELAAEARRIDELLESLKSACEVVGGTALLNLPGEVRDLLENGLGEGTADAIAVAKERGAVLWTDDLSTAIMAAAQLHVQRVWTQPVLRWSSERHLLSGDEMLAADGRLLTLGYSFTRLNPQEVAGLLRTAGWSLDKGVGTAVYRYVCEVATQGPKNCLVSAIALAHIWITCPNEEQARTIICRLLDGMGRAKSGPLIARRLYRLPQPLPGMDHYKMGRFRRMLRKWRSTMPLPSGRKR